MHVLNISCPDEGAMKTLGQQIFRGLSKGTLMTFEGELGAGKSFLARAIIHAAGYTGRVKSPTYTLIETYTIDPSVGELSLIAHLDLYRLEDPDELHYLGFDEVMDAHDLVMIEWPDKAGELLSEATIRVSIVYAENGGRVVTIESSNALELPGV